MLLRVLQPGLEGPAPSTPLVGARIGPHPVSHRLAEARELMKTVTEDATGGGMSSTAQVFS